MIRINIVAVGKVKEEYFRQATEEYSKRLSGYCEFTVTEVKEENYRKADEPLIEKIKRVEGERILKSLKGYAIAFAVEGKKCSSEKLAEKIESLSSRGEGSITFVIGGSYGLSDDVKKACKELLSVSDMTFPHTLMRVLATEQIYRAFTIIQGSEYHK